MLQSTINDLVLLSRQNDANAFRKLVEAHQSMVFSLAFRLLCDEDDAKDIVQETFIRIWKHLDKFNSTMKFSTWVYSITTNLCYDQLKNAKRKPVDRINSPKLVSQFISDENNELSVINSELAAIIRQMTSGLSPKQKLVFTLCDLESLELIEIQTITGLSANKIKSNLYLARQFIRKKLENL
jgi:RNA polymerase sigma-70 factor (ECF subfamily)